MNELVIYRMIEYLLDVTISLFKDSLSSYVLSIFVRIKYTAPYGHL